MAIKLVITDLDGTLLSVERTISDEAVAVIEEWKKRGGKFSFITGRPLPSVLKFAQRVKVNAPLVCCNGAELVEQRNGCQITIVNRGMRLKGLRRLMETAHHAGLTVLYYADGQEYAMGLTEWVAVRRARGDKNSMYPIQEHSEQFWNTGYAQKVNIMTDGRADAAEMLFSLIPELTEDYNVVIYADGGCEISPKGCDKAAGLRMLSDYMHLKMEEIMALGDNENDLEMLREAGIGAAVGNATEAAKEAADYICTAKNTEGVVEAMKRFCLQSGEEKR